MLPPTHARAPGGAPCPGRRTQPERLRTVRVLEMMYATARSPEYTSFTRAFLLPVRAIPIATALVGVWKL